jgi:hypothetical protein
MIGLRGAGWAKDRQEQKVLKLNNFILVLYFRDKWGE